MTTKRSTYNYYRKYISNYTVPHNWLQKYPQQANTLPPRHKFHLSHHHPLLCYNTVVAWVQQRVLTLFLVYSLHTVQILCQHISLTIYIKCNIIVSYFTIYPNCSLALWSLVSGLSSPVMLYCCFFYFSVHHLALVFYLKCTKLVFPQKLFNLFPIFLEKSFPILLCLIYI